MGKAKMPSELTPGYSKYSVAIMSLEDTRDFPDKPNPKWLKKDSLVSEKDITRFFDGIRDNDAVFVTGPTSFIPKGFDGLKVYFNPRNPNSLFIVAESRKIANCYAELKCLRKPYNEPRPKMQEDSLPSW
jgi:hypothetical protein